MTATTITPNTSRRPDCVYDTMPIAGQWRAGTSTHATVDLDPWNGAELTRHGVGLDERRRRRIRSRSWLRSGLGPTRHLAHEPTCCDTPPTSSSNATTTRSGGWSTKPGQRSPRAEIEWDIACAGLLEAAAMAHHAAGRILLSDIPGKENRVYRRPVGVVTVISPWNFPLHLSTRSVAPALALGNAVVLKPASDTPVSGGLLLADVLDQAGLPPGLLSVLVGEGSEIGDHIVTHPASRTISFTGSSAVGHGITRIAGIKRLGLELGGNGPLVILDDADLEHAVDAAIFGVVPPRRTDLHASQPDHRRPPASTTSSSTGSWHASGH